MSLTLKGRMIVLSLILSGFIVFNTKSSARPLTDNEKTTLLASVSNRSVVDMTIDLLWSNEIEIKPEAVRKIKQANIERMDKIAEKTSHPVEMPLYGFISSSGSNIRLVETRTRIGNQMRLRNETIIFGDRKKTEVQYETTTINANPFGAETLLSYRIDHKLKQGFIQDKRMWSGEEVLQFGKVDLDIHLDIIRLSKYDQQNNAKVSKYYDLSYEGETTIEGHLADVLQCKNPSNDKLRYIVYLDTSDWQLCRKIERYNNTSGLLSKITEYKAFEQVGDGGFIYPSSVIRRYFDKDGKEEKVEKINVEAVEIGLPIPDEVFKFNVPSDCTITDMRFMPPLIIEPLQSIDDAIREQINDQEIVDEALFEPTQISNDRKADVEELFIPDANWAMRENRPFILDLASRKLLYIPEETELEQVYRGLGELGRGDISWDSSLVVLRKAKAINVSMESQRPFKIVNGKWGQHCELPDGIKLPYYVLVNSSEGLDYLINIRSIETNGIKITYRKLSADESELFRLPEKSKK